jgi:anti-sigma B factor antagonist
LAHATEVHRFDLRIRPDRARVIVVLEGELDFSNAGAVRAALEELRTAGWRSIVVDLRELTFIDSTGLSLLLEADYVARRQGAALAIVDGSPPVARLLELVGLGDHFDRAEVP